MSMYSLLRQIATEAGDNREALHQIRITKGTAVATDSYRAARVFVADKLEVNSIPEGFLVPVEGELPDARLDWEQLVRDHLVVESEYAFPNTQHIFSVPLVTSKIEWEGAGSWNHGRRQKEWLTDLSQWAYFDAQRRKPHGIIRITMNKDGDLHYQRGMNVNHDKVATSFLSFENSHREMGAKAEGLVERFDDESFTESDFYLIGVYSAPYLASMWRGDADHIGVREDGEVSHSPLWFGYGAGMGDGLQMPIRL